MIVCDHIGDTLFSLGYIRAFREKYHVDKLAFVTTKHLMQLTDYYPDDIDDRIVISKRLLHIILQSEQSRIGVLIYRHIKNIIIVEPANHVVGGFLFIRQFPQVQLIDFIRYGILGLDAESRYVIPGSADMAPGQGAECKKIILTPAAQVVTAIPMQYYECLAERLTKCGYEVYTNVRSDRDKPIAGTRPFFCDLADLFQTLQTEKLCFIGLRSGLLDFVQHAGGSVVALYPPDSGMEHFFAMGQGVLDNSRVSQYTVTGEQEKDIEAILDQVKEDFI